MRFKDEEEKQQYLKLRNEYYRKLKDEGFVDIEFSSLEKIKDTLDFVQMPAGSRCVLKFSYSDDMYGDSRVWRAPHEILWETERFTYWNTCRQYRWVGKFARPIDKKIWRLYVEERNYREICEELGLRSKDFVFRSIKRTQKLMMKWICEQQERE